MRTITCVESILSAVRYSAVEILRWRFVCSKKRREGLSGPHSAETLGKATGGLPGTWAPLWRPGEAPTLWVAPKCSNKTRKGEKLCPIPLAPRAMWLRNRFIPYRQWHRHPSGTIIQLRQETASWNHVFESFEKILPWKWRQYILTKPPYVSTKIHAILS